MIPVNYNFRSMFVRKATTVATIFGVALVVFVLSSSQMLAHGIEKTMGSTGSVDNAIVLRKGADAELASNIENSMLGIIKSAPGVKKGTGGTPLAAAELVMVIAGQLADAPDQVANVLVRGITEDTTRLRTEERIIEGRPAKPGTNEVVIGKRLVGRFHGVDLGQTFELNKNRPVQVVGVFETGGSSFESEVWVDLDFMRAAFGRPAAVSSVTVALDSHASFDTFAAAMESDKQLGLDASRENLYYEKQSEGTSDFIKFLGNAIVFLFSLGAMIGAMITMYAAVANRRREIGTLRALGFSQFQVLASFLFESVFLAIIGGAVGALASFCMTFVHFSIMNFASWSEIIVNFEPTTKIIVSALVAGGAMGLIGGFLPALRAARTSPLVAMRD